MEPEVSQDPPLASILSHMNSLQNRHIMFLEVYFNIIVPSIPWFVSFKFCGYNSLSIFYLSRLSVAQYVWRPMVGVLIQIGEAVDMA
jgi:hypothetical protein